jgi:uncharacterized cupin superfamily protein
MSPAEVTLARLDPVPGERFVSLRRALGVESFGINLIVLEPRQRGRIHDHEHQEEVYLVIEGELALLLDGGVEQRLAEGQIARVPPGVRRQLANRGSGRLRLLALGGAGEHAGRDGRAWESFDEEGEGRAPQDVPLPGDLAPEAT